jgi:16S rRNA (uracil1498-N3)-methyltransferase
MHRFFVSLELQEGHPIDLTGDQAYQISRVLHLRPGERVTLLDNCGWACDAILLVRGEEHVRLLIERRWPAEGEPCTHITLFQAVLKGERFGWALQKCTEVGISRFVPMICERNVVADLETVEQKGGRWARIIREAAEQSGRARLPALEPARLFRAAVQPWPQAQEPSQQTRDLAAPQDRAGSLIGPPRLILWEEERATTLRHALAACNFSAGGRIELYVGPEGGFTGDELDLAQQYGLQPVSLGPRILRAETAGVVAAAAILYATGEM